MQGWVARHNRNRRARRRAAGSGAGELLESRQMLSSTYGSGTLNDAIPDQGQVLSTINVPDSLTIGDVNVSLNVDHTRDQDLDVFLISPGGTRIELMTDVGGGGNNFTGTILDDEAATPITSGSAPFTGTYRPEGSLSEFDGEDAQGNWTLEVNDDKRRETGTLISWSLEIENSQAILSIDNSAVIEGAEAGSVKIAHLTAGGPALGDGADYGAISATLGDLDGDGITDMAVAAGDNVTGGAAVFIQFMNADGTVRSITKIARNTNGGPDSEIGSAIAPLADMDGDGVMELAVGMLRDDTGGPERGAVYILFLNTDGTVKNWTKIDDSTPNGPTLSDGDRFGLGATSLGDLDGDGVVDLAVGAPNDDTGGFKRGAVHVLFLNSDGTVKSSTKIDSTSPNGPALQDDELFGRELTVLDDLDGDGVVDLAVGAPFDDTGGFNSGAVHILFLNPDGSLKGSTEIASGTNGGPTLAAMDNFGESVTSLGDFNGDGITGLAVGSPGDSTLENNRGAVYVLFLNADGTVQGTSKIDSNNPGGAALTDQGRFGASVALLGDLDGDGIASLAVGARHDNTGGYQFGDAHQRGAVHVLDLNPDGTPRGTVVNLTVTRSGDTSGTSTVDFTTVDGTAIAGVDYVATSGTLVFQPGETTSVVTVSIIGDTDIEPDEAFTVQLSNPTNAIIANGQGTGMILEDDGPPDIFIDDVQVTEASATVKIASGLNGGPSLASGDTFGAALVLLGDVDGDGIDDIAVGGSGDDTGGLDRGAVHVLLLNADGTAKSSTKIASTTGGGPLLADFDRFGISVGAPGDLDGDGIVDLAVGAAADPDEIGADDTGSVYIVLLNADGTAKSTTKIASGLNGGPALADGDQFARSIASLGDLDGDGVSDLAVGALLDDTGGNARGAVHILFMNADGTVASTSKIGSGTGGGPILTDDDRFGMSVTSLDDLDGDGVKEIAVGALRDDTGGVDRGAVHVLFMNPDGTAKSTTKIAHETNGGPILVDNDRFGRAVASLGDVDGDGISDLAVGAHLDDTGGDARGAVYVLALNTDGTVKSSTKLASGIGGAPILSDGDRFGIAVAALGDRNGDGVGDLMVGAAWDNAAYLHYLNANGTVKGTTVDFTVTRTGDTSGVSTVDYTTVDGTALAGSDYIAASGTLQFLAGEVSKTIRVELINDADIEFDEMFDVALSNATNGVIINGTGVATILDDDTPPPPSVDDYAVSESTSQGSIISGSLADTQASDNVSEALRETETGGKPSNRTTLLEHTWTFNVTGGDTVTFFVEAWHTANSEGDDFLFAYSTDGTNFTSMLTVTKTADDDAAQSYVLPAGISGTVTIRVTDTDQTPGHRTRDTLYVDQMFIRSESASAAAMASVLLEEDDEQLAFSV